MDYQIFVALNSWAKINPALTALVVFFSKYVIYLVAIGLILYWIFPSPDKLRTRRMLISAFMAFVLARIVLTELIRRLYHRDRPFLTYHVTQLIPKDAEQSFPSGHASAMFAIAMGLYFYNRKLGAWMLVLAALVSISRVIAGVHYPSDIIGGAVVGIVSAWLIEKIFGRYLDKWTGFFSSITDKILFIGK